MSRLWFLAVKGSSVFDVVDRSYHSVVGYGAESGISKRARSM